MERERRKISLDSIAATTKVGRSLFEGLERDDVSRWPNGLFRRSFIRAYATAVGLDAEDVVRQFLERFPDPSDALPEPVLDPSAPNPFPQVASGERLRLTLANTARAFAGGRVLSAVEARWKAVTVDAAVIIGSGATFFLFMDAFWVPMAVFMVCYYWGSILVVGNTPGVCLVAPLPLKHEPAATDTSKRRGAACSGGMKKKASTSGAKYWN